MRSAEAMLPVVHGGQSVRMRGRLWGPWNLIDRPAQVRAAIARKVFAPAADLSVLDTPSAPPEQMPADLADLLRVLEPAPPADVAELHQLPNEVDAVRQEAKDKAVSPGDAAFEAWESKRNPRAQALGVKLLTGSGLPPVTERCKSASFTANPTLGSEPGVSAKYLRSVWFLQDASLAATRKDNLGGSAPTISDITACQSTEARSSDGSGGSDLLMPPSVQEREHEGNDNFEQRSQAVQKFIKRMCHHVHMERDPEREQHLRSATVGARVAYWRGVRGLGVRELARKVKCSPGTISTLENGGTKKGKTLAEIAQALRVAYDYLATGKGDPEPKAGGIFAPALQATDKWPMPNIPRSRIEKLDEIELGFLELEIARVLDRIETIRRSKRA